MRLLYRHRVSPAFCDNEHAAHRRVLLGNHIRCLGPVLCLFIDSCLILRRGCNASGLLSLLVFLRCAPRWDIFFHNLFSCGFQRHHDVHCAHTVHLGKCVTKALFHLPLHRCSRISRRTRSRLLRLFCLLTGLFCSRRQQQDNADCRQQEVQHPLLLFLFPEKRRCLFPHRPIPKSLP